jgi:AcrR family transcriptional regulator
MPKSFTEQERAVIRQNLINACRECWNRYGYQKTNIRELAETANISTGAFYQFYESKELIFADAAQSYETALVQILDSYMAKHPGKQGLAGGIKALTAEMKTMRWIEAFLDDWPIILRKLPEDFMHNDFLRDLGNYEKLIKKYNLVPKKQMKEITQIINFLLIAFVRHQSVPGDTGSVFGIIVDAVINSLFE